MFRRASILLCCTVALAVAGCGGKSSSSSTPPPQPSTTVHFAKTKFVFHAGLALGAFRYFIYKPIKAGVLAHPLSHKLAIIKLGLAGLFVYHELKLAAQDVRASKTLSALFAPLTALADKVKALAAAVKSGQGSPADAETINSGITSIKSTAAAHGQPITEQVPSAGQLAAGVA